MHSPTSIHVLDILEDVQFQCWPFQPMMCASNSSAASQHNQLNGWWFRWGFPRNWANVPKAVPHVLGEDVALLSYWMYLGDQWVPLFFFFDQSLTKETYLGALLQIHSGIIASDRLLGGTSPSTKEVQR